MLGHVVERNVDTFVSAQLAESWNIGADDAAAGKKGLGYGKAKTLRERWRQQEFTVAIAPLQFVFGDAIEQYNAIGNIGVSEKAQDRIGLRAGDAHDDETGLWREFSGAQQTLEYPQKEEDVLVAAMLGHAQ